MVSNEIIVRFSSVIVLFMLSSLEEPTADDCKIMESRSIMRFADIFVIDDDDDADSGLVLFPIRELYRGWVPTSVSSVVPVLRWS